MKKETFDFIVVGSGAGGATAARYLAPYYKILVIEEGPRFIHKDFSDDVFNVETKVFRSFGLQVTKGRAIYPILQGVCMGGSTVINGAICNRLPKDIYNKWVQQDPPIGESIPFERIEKISEKIEKDLGVTETLTDLHKFSISKTLKMLGWTYGAMKRNAAGCRGSGNCLQGCPTHSKNSLEKSYIDQCEKLGVIFKPLHRVKKIKLIKNRAVGVMALDKVNKRTCLFGARFGVVVAAGVIHTPLLLKKSKVKNPNLGKNFQCHLSIGVIGQYSKKVRDVEGQPQGIEVIPLENERIKIATQLLPPELLLARIPIVGKELGKLLIRNEYFTSWMGSIPSESQGHIEKNIFGTPISHFNPTKRDMGKAILAVKKIAELMFAAGAIRVFPGIYGAPRILASLKDIEKLDKVCLDPRNFLFGIGHIFGTCKMGSCARNSVVDMDFKVHGYDHLYVVDASILPTNVAVNPQLTIMAVSSLGAEKIKYFAQKEEERING